MARRTEIVVAPPLARDDESFVEVHQEHDDGAAPAPDEVEAYVSSIQPKFCGKAIKELSAALPLRRRATNNDETDQSPSLPTGGTGRVTCEQLSKVDGDDDVCLGHLKRVRRPIAFASGEVSPTVSSADESQREDKKKGDDGNDGGLSESNKSRKRRRSSNGSNGNDKDKSKGGPSLIEIVIGTTTRVDSILNCTEKDDTHISGNGPNLQRIIDQYGLVLEKRQLPGRPAKLQNELDEWNARISPKYQGVGWWPTIFFHKRTEEFKEEERRLTEAEIRQMKAGIKAAVADAQNAKAMWMNGRNEKGMKSIISGVAIIDPRSGEVVSTASCERRIQGKQLDAAGAANKCQAEYILHFPDVVNPLCSSVILAIQGVSRKERNAAAGKGMDSDEFKNGQYLCTGYDVYVTKEPDVFEAMALVHSRVRRVIFGIPNTQTGGLGGTGRSTAVNSLPGTNHHFRVFRCTSKDITTECSTLHSNT